MITVVHPIVKCSCNPVQDVFVGGGLLRNDRGGDREYRRVCLHDFCGGRGDRRASAGYCAGYSYSGSGGACDNRLPAGDLHPAEAD